MSFPNLWSVELILGTHHHDNSVLVINNRDAENHRRKVRG